MIEVTAPTSDQYEAILQHGSGVPFYSGSMLQRGHGVGGLFRRLASGILPLLPTLGKAALGVASDKLSGVPMSRALKSRSLEVGKELLRKTRKPVKKRTPTARKRIRKSDVFGSI